MTRLKHRAERWARSGLSIPEIRTASFLSRNPWWSLDRMMFSLPLRGRWGNDEAQLLGYLLHTHKKAMELVCLPNPIIRFKVKMGADSGMVSQPAALGKGSVGMGTYRLQFQIFRKLSHDPVATAMPSSVTPKQLTRLSCPAKTPAGGKRRGEWNPTREKSCRIAQKQIYTRSHVISICVCR